MEIKKLEENYLLYHKSVNGDHFRLYCRGHFKTIKVILEQRNEVVVSLQFFYCQMIMYVTSARTLKVVSHWNKFP